MSNTAVTCSIVAKMALPILENMCVFARNANRDYEDEFSGNVSRGYMPGSTINIKRPPRYTYRTGRVASAQATTETSVPLTLSQGGCDLNFNGLERTLSFNKLEDKIAAAVATVANKIDFDGLALAHLATFNAVGTVGTFPNTQATALAAATAVNQRLDEMAAPRDRQRYLTLSPGMNGAMIQGTAGLFNAASKIGEQYGSGMMVDSLGLVYGMDQNVGVHTNGTQAAATATVSGAGQTGSTITCSALGGTITAGTVLTFAGSNAVNPQNRTTTGNLMQFVVTADVAAAATSIPISPAIVTSGAFQNVTASPTNGGTITILGAASASYQANIGCHKNAFTLAMVPMYAPPSGTVGAKVSQQTNNGFTVKVTEYYDGTNDNYNMRLDVLYGWAATYPELSCKLVA